MNLTTAAAGFALVGALGGTTAVANAATSTTAPSTHSATTSTTHAHGGGLKADLDKLVANKTITADQEAKILAGLKAGRHAPGAMNHRVPRHRGDGEMKNLAAALKLSQTQLRADFAKGQTLGEIAKAQGVSQADVTKALSKDADARVAKFVETMWNAKMGQHKAA